MGAVVDVLRSMTHIHKSVDVDVAKICSEFARASEWLSANDGIEYEKYGYVADDHTLDFLQISDIIRKCDLGVKFKCEVLNAAIKYVANMNNGKYLKDKMTYHAYDYTKTLISNSPPPSDDYIWNCPPPSEIENYSIHV